MEKIKYYAVRKRYYSNLYNKWRTNQILMFKRRATLLILQLDRLTC